MKDREHRLSRPLETRPLGRDDVWDLALGLFCLAIAVGVHLGGSEAVAANLEPSAFSVLLTTLAVGPLVVRRRYPLTVLALTLAGLLLLVATRNTVGASTLGCTVALYTVVAVAPRRRAVLGVALMVVAVAVGLAMRPVDLSDSGAVVTLVIFTGAAVFGYTVRERREGFEAEVATAHERAARSAADERLRITRELHDILGHAMSVMVVQAGVAEQLIGADPGRARTAVVEIGSTGRRALSEMRQLIGALREGDPGSSEALPRDPMPTLAQLPALVARVEAAGLPVTLTVHGTSAALPPGLELAAYRVVQEALTNCLKHAGATRARRRPRARRRRGAGHRARRRSRRKRRSAGGLHGPGPGRHARASGGLQRAAECRAGGIRWVPRGGDVAGERAMIRVVVADDQELVRTGFALILGSDPGIEIVGQAEDGVAAVAAAREQLPDVVLMDIRMPGMDGIEATRHITGSPATAGVRVLVLTTFDGDEYVVDALRAGASGFLLKDTPPADLINAVSVVAAGDALLAPAITLRLIDRFVRVAAPASGAETVDLPPLTERENDVLLAVAEGLSNAEIAERLVVSYSTVKTHVSHLLTKLDARDRAQLVMLAHRAGVTG